MKARKPKTLHRCRDCGFETSQWRGRCPSCEAWQTLEEITLAPAGRLQIASAPRARRGGSTSAAAGPGTRSGSGATALAPAPVLTGEKFLS
ncbi:MAG: hypothetical protein ACAI25_08205, partial [Planctomycetota bacterium]